MGTVHQYHLLTAPPKREAIFSRDKAVHGTTFAFHGSRIENWHSILRNGLVNASGTKLQVNGAAYGAGVYLSPMAQTSIGYSGYTGAHTPVAHGSATAQQQSGFLKSEHLVVMALCEVVKSPDLKKHSANIWTHKNHDHVVTRMLFVYEGGDTSISKIMSIRTENASFLHELKQSTS